MLKARSGRRVTLPPPGVNKGNTDNSQNEVTKQEGVDFDLLEYDIGSDIFYLSDPETPYSGKVFRLYKNGQKDYEINYKDGKREGLATAWHENGLKKAEGNYKDGKEDGEENLRHEDGLKRKEKKNLGGYLE